MKQAVADHRLRAENEKLLADLQSANYLLRAVMDQLDTGAIAVDAKGIVQAVNRVGAAPGDLVAILEALKQAGSLTAELIVI